MLEIKKFSFHDETAAPGDGNVLENEQGSSLVIAVSGTFTGTLIAQGELGDNWYDLAVVNLSTAETAENIRAAGAYTVAGVEGFDHLRVKASALSAGSVTVYGRLCY